MKTFMNQMEFDFTSSNTITNSVNTQHGVIPSSDLGITLVHEHIFNRFPFTKKKFSEDFTLNELSIIKKLGVQTIVDLTPYTSLGNYKRILDETDINIICCIGFYLEKYVPKTYKTATVLELVNLLAKQIHNGRGFTKIRPGILKVAGKGEIMTPLENRLFTSIGILQRENNIPIATHSPKGAISHINTLIKSGANPEHIFISHLDKGINSKKGYEERLHEINEVFSTGAYVLFSEFGSREYNKKNINAPIMKILKTLFDSGKIDKILISADSNWRWKNGKIVVKDSFRGGNKKTYDYVFTQIIPTLKSIGLSENDIYKILVNNPKKLFDFF